MIKKIFSSEHEMMTFAASLAPRAHGCVIYLSGPLGAGKTTFARGFLRGLGYADKVKSPSYTLVEPYRVKGDMIYHFDCYRLVNASELDDIGARDYFTREATCLIEWPEKGIPVLPAADVTCTFSVIAEGREVQLVAGTARGEACLLGI